MSLSLDVRGQSCHDVVKVAERDLCSQLDRRHLYSNKERDPREEVGMAAL